MPGHEMRVAVVHNVPLRGRPDSEDVIDQVNLVVEALKAMGHPYRVFPVGLDGPTGSGPTGSGPTGSGPTGSGPTGSGPAGSGLSVSSTEVSVPSASGVPLNESVFFLLLGLKKYAPNVIFNLLEDTPELHVHQHYFAAMLELFDYDFTGAGHLAVLTTTDKVLSKQVMQCFGIKSPAYHVYRGSIQQITVPAPWIAKPALEDASVGIEDASVFYDEQRLRGALRGIYERHGRQPILIEHFIGGREFNVALLENAEGGVDVLPIAEMTFNAWPEGKPRIVGYRAKWDGASFEYNNTLRRFNPPDADLQALRDISLKCWKVFNLRGYARVDIRVDETGGINVLEANANPCIAPDSGFIAAAQEAGMDATDVVRKILETAASSRPGGTRRVKAVAGAQ